MALKVEKKVPVLDFSRELEEGSAAWKALSKKLKDVMQEYGIFHAVYEKQIPAHLNEDFFKASKDLFDLPTETKMKNTDSRPYYGYVGWYDGLYENLGIRDAHIVDNTEDFTSLMWPEGNPSFCQTVNTVSSKLHDLELTILKMLLKSYEMEKYYDSYVESTTNILRLMRYVTPKSDDSVLALPPHVDTTVLTVLCQNSIPGLEAQLVEDSWTKVEALDGTVTVFAGASLKAWSNGRIRAVNHRVTLGGEKTRYTVGSFMAPKEREIVEAPKELVDEEHPQLYRPFEYREYLDYVVSVANVQKSLEVFAGI